MPKTVCQSVAWFKRYKTLKSVTVGRSVGRSVGSLNLRKFSYSAKTRSAFGLARNHESACTLLCVYVIERVESVIDVIERVCYCALIFAADIVPSLSTIQWDLKKPACESTEGPARPLKKKISCQTQKCNF